MNASFDAVEIRAITSADTEEIVAIRALSDQAFRGTEHISDGDDARTRSYLAQPDTFGLVAVLDAHVVGMIIAMHAWRGDEAGTIDPGLCHIAMVFVAPDCWSRGIGSRLVAAMLDAARERGYERAQLWTQDFNLRAQRLYLRHGFALGGRSKINDRSEPGERIVLLTRDL